MTLPSDPDARRHLAARFFRTLPHSVVLGLEVESVTDNVVVARVPYREELVGNPLSGVVHGGVITTLVDQTSGTSVFIVLDRLEAIVTLDLRIDYLTPATPGEAIRARAHCYRLTRQIAFVRCDVYHSDPEDPIATSMSTFMRTGQLIADGMEVD